MTDPFFDVCIVGGGPAGGQCARELAAAGKKVILIERVSDFSLHDFSTAGTPNSLLSDFSLPDQVIGSPWHRFLMHSSNEFGIWESENRAGVVLDFIKLRAFLAEETEKHGGKVLFGCTYLDHTSDGDYYRIRCRQDKKERLFSARYLVDATGGERRVLGKKRDYPGFTATGIEYLVEVSEEEYARYAGALSFYLGQKWMPQGYGWIFPMAYPRLKVGVGRYFMGEERVPGGKDPLRKNLDRLCERVFDSPPRSILDRHGKSLYYTYGQKGSFVEGRILGLGDAISVANPLAFEGIRHAMMTGRFAAEVLIESLERKTNRLKRYQKRVHAYCRFRWKLCEKIMLKLYGQAEDANVDRAVHVLKKFDFQEMMDFCFKYSLSLGFKFFCRFHRIN